MSEDLRREQQRQIWEKQELENAAKRDIHYQDVLFNGEYLYRRGGTDCGSPAVVAGCGQRSCRPAPVSLVHLWLCTVVVAAGGRLVRRTLTV